VIDFLVQTVEALRGKPWAPFAFVGIYGTACLFAPISIFPVAGGVLFGFWVGFLCNLAGAVSGAFGAFLLARRWGRGLVMRVVRKRLESFDAVAETYGFWTLLSLRLMGFPPFLVTNYLSGLWPISWRVYLGATVFGILPWTILITYFSAQLWQVLLDAGVKGFKAAAWAHGRYLFMMSVLGVATMATTLYLNRRRRRRARGKTTFKRGSPS
jgi:uncharacterized membrane protein YdjX (TVP38/TMEM64 family)